ncbi:MAG: glycosyltransferase family 39 protein [Thermoguttaceae bacterium]
MQSELRNHVLIILIAGLIFFLNLGGPKLWDRDEPRNAGCAVEMMERGDWVTPMFNHELRIHKPVLLYWFMMAAYAVFGVNEFAARFWSAALGLGTLLATYHIGRRLFSAKTGLWAAVILASCMMFPVAARAATPDSVLIFFTTLATLVYVLGAFRPNQGQPSSTHPVPQFARTYFPDSWPTVALMYALMGVAVLAKGPVGLVVPTAVIGMFLLIVRLPATERSSRPPEDAFADWLGRLLRPFAPRHVLAVCWSMRPLTAIGMSLAVALPWYLWVGFRTQGEWPKGFFLVHHFQRAIEPMESHDGPFFYYLVAILASFFPWSLLLIPTLEQTAAQIGRRLASRAEYLFLACWASVYIAVFSLARTKLPSYVTPALPAFALLTACFIDQWLSQGQRASQYWFRFAFSGLILAGVGIGIGVAVAGYCFLPGDSWLGVIGLFLVIGGLAGRWFLKRFLHDRAIAAFGLTAVVFACMLFSFTSVKVAQHQRCNELFDAVRATGKKSSIAAYNCLEPSWVFYARQPIQQFDNDDQDEMVRFLHDSRDHYLITTARHWKTIQPLLPHGTAVLADVPYFMRPDRLLLIACSPKEMPARASQLDDAAELSP